jgi:hypothetical protein
MKSTCTTAGSTCLPPSHGGGDQPRPDASPLDLSEFDKFKRYLDWTQHVAEEVARNLCEEHSNRVLPREKDLANEVFLTLLDVFAEEESLSLIKL